jgi:hypothetical protein
VPHEHLAPSSLISPLETLHARAAIFFVLVLEHLALTPRLMRLIDGKRWLVVAGRRFGRRRPHPGPVVLDDDDLGVNDPGQHQR